MFICWCKVKNKKNNNHVKIKLFDYTTEIYNISKYSLLLNFGIKLFFIFGDWIII